MSPEFDSTGRRLLDGALARMLETPSETWRAESDAAAVCARYLACHPKVAWVRYPGLPGDPLFDEAARTLARGFGPEIRYGLVDGGERVLRCAPCDPLELVGTLEGSLA